MTNEEIEKRFKFDLEMGRFNSNELFGRHDIYFNKSKLSFKLLTLLKNIGYDIDEVDFEIENTSDLQKYLENGKGFISISQDYDELLDIFAWGKTIKIMKQRLPKCFNQIPSYITRYSID